MRRWTAGLSMLAVSVGVFLAVATALPAVVAPAVSAPIRINAGGSGLTDGAGNEWRGDRSYSSSAGYGYLETDGIGGRAAHLVTVTGAQENAIFASERWGMEGYRIDVPNGTYDLQFLFAETFSGITGPGQRVFDISVQSERVISRLDVYDEAGFATALTKDVRGVAVTDGRIDIAFTARVEQPMIKGIVVTAVQAEATPTLESAATPTPEPTPTPVPATPTAEATPTVTPTPTPEGGDQPQRVSVAPVPAAVAHAPLRVNVGGDAFQDRQGHDWLADREYSAENGWGYVGGDLANYRQEYHGGVGISPHSSGREGMQVYRFHVPDPPKGSFYAVTLDFSGRLDGSDGFGERVFYVTVGETVPGEQTAVVVGPIDPWTAFHSLFVPDRYRVEYIRPVDGVLEVAFTPVIGQPVINAITIDLHD